MQRNCWNSLKPCPTPWRPWGSAWVFGAGILDQVGRHHPWARCGPALRLVKVPCPGLTRALWPQQA